MRTITEIHHRPPISVADRLHTAARFVEALGDPGTGVLHATVFGDGVVSFQVVQDAGTFLDRHTWLTCAAGILADREFTEPTGYRQRGGSWGNVSVGGTYEGVPVEVFTPLSWAEARDLGIAVCSDCGHTDHDGDVCLAAMVDANGDDRACECGRPDAEAILLAGGVISDFDVAAAQAIAIVNGDRHEERCEASDDDLRDAAAERDTR